MGMLWKRLLVLPGLGMLSACAMGGEVLPATSHAVAVDSAAVGLEPAPAGYGWYRSGQEFVLAAKLSGRVLRSQPAPSPMAESMDPFGRSR